MWSPPQQLPNDFGVLDGAMLEWVGDWYDKDYYKRTTAWVDPHGPETGSERVLRGEAWGGPGYVSLSIRNSRVPSSGYKDVGFRCAVESH
jgi:formylglycine-generating enzyme required for sulfatase activity